MNPKKLLVLSIALLSGCTATQLRYETLNQAGTVESITEKQVFFNLEKFDKNPYAIPSQVTVIAGSASTTDSVSPTFMAPLGTSTVITTQLAKMTSASLSSALANSTSNSVATAVATGTSSSSMNGISAGSVGGPVTGAMSSVTNGTTGGITTTTTNGTMGGTTTTSMTGTNGGTTDSTATTHPNQSLSVALSDNWMESWTLDPVVNPDVLKRLSALYRYVLGKSDVIPETKHPDDLIDGIPRKNWVEQHKVQIDQQFFCDYPLPQISPSPGEAPSTMTTKVSTQTDHGEPMEITRTGPDSHAGGSIMVKLHCRIDSKGDLRDLTIKIKPSALSLPGCVVCLDGNDKLAEDDGATVEDVASSVEDAAKLAKPVLYVNPNLNFGFITRSSIASNGNSKNIGLGHGFYGDIGLDPNPHRAFHEFELFIDAATIVGGGASGGSSNSNQKVLSVPISPNGFLLR